MLRLIEKAAALSQGKGIGSHTTRAEARMDVKLLLDKLRLVVDDGGKKGSRSAHSAFIKSLGKGNTLRAYCI